MAYEPKTWECGDVVTADALNHIEQGIAESGGGTSQFVVHGSEFRGTTFVADKTYAEIAEAYQNGADIVLDVAIGETTHYIASLGRLLATEADFGGVHWNGSGTTHKAEIFTASIASDGTVSCVTSSI